MAKEVNRSIFRALLRRKPIERSSITLTRLDRCLTTLDLTTLGIGSTLGLGVYVLAGQVAATKAGPAVTLSFFIAAVASVFAGLCYAEFGARVPKSGSAYVYSYITVGEFMAFIIGWNLILEYAIGSASIARGYSGYVDSLINGKLQKFFTHYFPLNFGISPYFDFFAFGIAMLVAGLLSVGVKKSTRLNAIFTAMNLIGVVYAIICGSFKLNLYNWEIPEKDIPSHEPSYGTGGFLPYGFSGLMAGAATCFYGFVGFDMIATTGEEVKNPAKAIPLSIVFSLLVIFIAYCGVSAVQTLMVPYYLQNQLAPLPYVFNYVGYDLAAYVLTGGAMAGLYSSLLGTMYPLTRVLYAMGNDRTIFSFFSYVHHRLKTPIWATLASGIFSGIMAALFGFQELCDMMSIGTLLAYTLVSVSVLMLRYQKRNFAGEINEHTQEQINDECDDDTQQLISEENSGLFRRIFNLNNEVMITPQTQSMCKALVAILCVFSLMLSVELSFLQKFLFALNPYALLSVIVTLILTVIALIALKRQPQTDEKMSFKVPAVPLTPILSVFVNFYLMLNLSHLTWIRFGIWMFIGLLMYFLYGIVESVGYLSDEQKQSLEKERAKKSQSSPLSSRKSSLKEESLPTSSSSSSGFDSNLTDETKTGNSIDTQILIESRDELKTHVNDIISEPIQVNSDSDRCIINDSIDSNDVIQNQSFNDDTQKINDFKEVL